MLAAHRDPFHPSAHEPMPSGSRFTRTMNVLQIAGALLAIPVGVGSAVTMYRSNFSVEATCQSLRGNIVALIDKRVDTATRHMLVRRDVESFEQACGVVDPDATAAFKVLLAAEKKPAAVTPVVARPAEAKPQEAKSATVARKPEPRVEAVKEAKEKAVKAPRPAVTESWIAEEEGASDVVWTDSVRRALGATAPDAAPVKKVKEAAVVAPPPIAAPALPPGIPISLTPPPRVDPDRPVPPGSIPEVTANDVQPRPEEPSSRFGWIARIPVLGQALVR